MPESYVRTLFDGYAGGFDRALTEGLSYRAPELLLRAVEASGVRMKFGSVLDLGCGTGLAGAAFRPYCDWLVGVDLSPAMLAQARAKGLTTGWSKATSRRSLPAKPWPRRAIISSSPPMCSCISTRLRQC
jgi:predicted TPR repeat methyltransferase